MQQNQINIAKKKKKKDIDVVDWPKQGAARLLSPTKPQPGLCILCIEFIDPAQHKEKKASAIMKT